MNGVPEWDSYDTINNYVKTDFTKENWKEELEKEMYKTLMMYADEHDLMWSKPNNIK